MKTVYGSNMDRDRLTKRKEIAPEPSHVLATGKLNNYKPRFSHYSMNNKDGVLDNHHLIEEFNNYKTYNSETF